LTWQGKSSLLQTCETAKQGTESDRKPRGLLPLISVFDGKEIMIDILPFSIELYEEVLTLWQACEGIGLSDADSRENIQRYLDRNRGMSFVATVDGRVVGAVLAGHDGRRGYMHHLAVHADYRRQGIGRKLVELCAKALADAGIQKCHIFIFNHNTAGIAFWNSMGWTPRADIGVISKAIEPSPEGDY
jgi:N-acetylglutamate synthase